jgi:hypothetical protein
MYNRYMSRQPVTSPLTIIDLPWVLKLAKSRRALLAPRAPRFWRPSQDADERHSEWLRHLIESVETLSIRTETGFLFGENLSGVQTIVDDMAMESPDAWMTDGVELLRAAEALGRPLRFVCPLFERERAQAAKALGLDLVETWWHLDLPASGAPSLGSEDVSCDGGVGRLVVAPPIYDPGGPVLMVTRADHERALALVEEKAARAGATVSVVSQLPTDGSAARTGDRLG